MFADEVTRPKIADPENYAETNSKIAFESCWRFRQVSPSEPEIEVWACSLFVCDSKRRAEVKKGSGKESLRSREGWTKGDGEGRSARRERALLTDAKTSRIVAKVKQTTVAVVRFRSALAARKVSSKLPFYRSHCGIIAPIRYYRREELNKSGVSPRSIHFQRSWKWINPEN